MRIVRHWVTVTDERRVCMAGGVALHCVANGKLLRSGIVDDLWIQPAAGDAGGALGAALAVWHRYLGKPRTTATNDDAAETNDPKTDTQRGSYLGPAFSNEEAKRYFDAIGAPYREVSTRQLATLGADILADEKVLGWHQGRMEFGPRALGGRSIIGDPHSPKMQRIMNLKIKYRESFRRFAPSVLYEDVQQYFELDGPSPYMLLVANVRPERRLSMTAEQQQLFGIDKLNVPRSDVPAITHVDYSARVQTVDGKYNPRFYALIKAFKKKTGCAVVVNTSFNVRGEPIVCTPQDSYLCFMRTEMDCLMVENLVLDKREPTPLKDDDNWRDSPVGSGSRCAKVVALALSPVDAARIRHEFCHVACDSHDTVYRLNVTDIAIDAVNIL